ncbi:MAG TPA: alpha/beta hydrolase [Jatrophihabitans sp.]|nr:alpha/beta hydrolase [Jatrophihabitans sp.]
MSTPTIVLLHGQPDTSASFQPLRRRLREQLPGVRVLTPDRPGYGANPRPALGYAGNVEWLLGWLAGAGAGPTVLVGHSWAGGIALLAGAQAPDRVAGLVLLASVGPSCLLAVDRLLAAPVAGELIAWGTLQLGRPLISRRARHLVISQQDVADRPYARTSGLAMRHRPVWRSFLTEQRALLRELPAIEHSLARIDLPTAVISGTRDPLIPAETPRQLHRRIDGSTEHRIDGGGHDLQLREPVAVARLVAEFARPLIDDRSAARAAGDVS